MAYNYTNRDGERVEVSVAAAYDRLEVAFRNRFGLDLLVSSGTRTNAEQWDLWRKYQNGTGNLAAYPGTSNHEEGGPRGPRALDVRDSGRDAGVTVRGTTRANWLRANAPIYGFNPAGYGFSQIEPWHIEYTGALGGSGSGAGGGSSSFVDGNWGPATTTALQKALGVSADGQLGPITVRALQTKLKAMGHKIEVDGDMGPATIRAMQTFIMGAKHADGILGTETVRALQSYLQSGGKFIYKNPNPAPAPDGKLVVDGLWGASTTRALQKVLGVTVDGELGPNTYKALQTKLNAIGYSLTVDGDFGPATITALQTYLLGHKKADGILGPETVSGLQNYLNSGGVFAPAKPTVPGTGTLVVDGDLGPATIKALQTKLGITADGEWGADTTRALQKATGQTQDGEVGPRTIKALQMNVGASVDGQMGPETVKKLQEFLNANKNFTVVVVEDTSGTDTEYPKPAAPTYSGASWWHHSPNSSPRRAGDVVQYFVVHHAADTNSVETQRDRFMRANDRNVSPNWLIGKDGSVSEIVPPDDFRAWTTGQFDYKAVTVETQNTSREPNWGISEESHIAIAKLVAWASKRYGFPIDRQHVIGHREVPNVPATACPGPSMDLDKIVRLAKEYAKGTPTEPTPEVPEEPEVPEVPEVVTWTITLPRDEAIALGKFLDQFRKLLP